MADVLRVIHGPTLPKALICYPPIITPPVHHHRNLLSPFARLPDDLFVAILSFLDIRDILSLRCVCKGLEMGTRIRSLWVHLAHREVLDRNLPWPSYALPLTIVPSETIEEHTVRAVKIASQWVPGSESHLRRFSRCIFRAPNSIGWLQVIKGRWLIVELRGQCLEVWDIQNDQGTKPVVSHQGLKGNIDGSCINVSEGSSVVLILSTSSHVTTTLKIDLPYLGESRQVPNFVVLDIFEGYSGLLHAHGGLAVFSRSVLYEKPLVRDIRTGSIVYLGGYEATQKPQQLLSARIIKDNIILVGSWMVEVYPIANIRPLLMNGLEDASSQVAYATQCLAYPEGQMAHQVAFLEPQSPPLEHDFQNKESGFYLGILLSRQTDWIRLHIRPDSGSNSTMLTSSAQFLFETMEYQIIACCWGESGQRMLLALSHRGAIHVLCGVIPSVLNHRCLQPSFEFEDNAAFKWYAIRKGDRDLFTGFAFDEASGVCAIATSSGRIWVDDFSNSLSPPDKHLEENLNVPKVPLHPDPSWPELHPLPWPANVAPNPHPSEPFFFEPIFWSTEVDQHFPMMNDPKCYGGARWFVNEALHIPGSASLVMFTTSALHPTTDWHVKILQVSDGRFIAVIVDVGEQRYRVKLLKQDVSISQIQTSDDSFMGSEAGVILAVDDAVVRRYVVWRNLLEEDPDVRYYLW